MSKHITAFARAPMVASALTAGLMMCGAPDASAQLPDSAFTKLNQRISTADTVFVTTRDAGEIRGRYVRLSADAIVIATEQGERTIPFDDVGWIEKRGDPLWNGALIGAGIFGFSMMGAAGASCSPSCSSQVPEGLAFGAAIGAAIGALIDRLTPGRTLLYGKRAKESHGVSVPTPPAMPSESSGSLASLWRQVAPGDRITVRTTSEGEIEGRFERASASSVTVAVGHDLREIPGSDVAEVRRYRGGTHLKKGLWIGIPVGALSGANACYGDLHAPPGQYSDTGVPCGVGVLLGAAAGGAAGALIGGMTWGSSVVYRVAPIASPHRVGVIASFAF